MAAPVVLDEELELRIDSLAYGGNGVARLDGFVLFVRRGLPGDLVRARVTKVKRNHAEALTVDVLEPGPARVDAPCSHYPACGGCRFQDLAYEAQVEAKEEQVARRARAHRRARRSRRSSRSSPPSRRSATATSSSTRSRRRRRGPRSGLHRAGRWDEVLPIERCWLTTDLGNAIRNAVRDWAREERLLAYDQTTHEGFLRHLVVREGRNTGQALVVLVTAPGELPDTGALRRLPPPLSRGAVDPPGGQRPAGRGDARSAHRACSGARTRSRNSSAASASASARTRSCRRTRPWPSGSTSSPANTPGSPAARPSTTSTAASARSA